MTGAVTSITACDVTGSRRLQWAAVARLAGAVATQRARASLPETLQRHHRSTILVFSNIWPAKRVSEF